MLEPLSVAYTVDLPHGFLAVLVSSTDLYGLGIVDDPVQDRICYGRLRELTVPASRSELRAEDR